MSLPNKFHVRVYPASGLQGTLRAQPSKNYTTRYLLAAALSPGSKIFFPSQGEDAQALVECLRAWGATLIDRTDHWQVIGWGTPRSGVTLNPGNAGAVARFLMGIAPLTTDTTFVTDYDSLQKRPHHDLHHSLRSMGALVTSNGYLPARISGPVRSNHVRVSTQKSSQYASALMFLAPLLPEGLTLYLDGEIKSEAPLRQTLHTLAQFGIQPTMSDDLRTIVIPASEYQSRELTVSGDYPSAMAILVAASLRPGKVNITGLDPNDLQGERLAVGVLQQMGASISQSDSGFCIQGRKPLRAVTCDGDLFTDAVQVMSAAAAHAEGTTTWQNIRTLRYKECDRIAATCLELQKLGWTVNEQTDALSIIGGNPTFEHTVTHSHADHRMVMLLTLLGLAGSTPIIIEEAHHIRKSYPAFFSDLTALGARFDYLEL